MARYFLCEDCGARVSGTRMAEDPLSDSPRTLVRPLKSDPEFEERLVWGLAKPPRASERLTGTIRGAKMLAGGRGQAALGAVVVQTGVAKGTDKRFPKLHAQAVAAVRAGDQDAPVVIDVDGENDDMATLVCDACQDEIAAGEPVCLHSLYRKSAPEPEWEAAYLESR